MPTGTGKTITFLSCAKRKAKKCLILVHRNELLEQTYEKAKLIGYQENEIALICSEDKQELKTLSIAMVPTLIRNLTKYSSDDIEMVIIDEAHHATAASYQKVLSHFDVMEKKKLLLGFTATPLRGDGECLGKIFLSHSFKMTLSEATQNGYICPVHGVRVDIKRSLEAIEMLGNDYNPEQLDKVMNCESINELIASKCEHLMKTPALIFCTSVDHAEKIDKLLRDKNRKSAVVSYRTPKKELQEIICSLKRGEIEFLTNAVKLSEGFDHPPVQSIILARPTRSPVLYKQMIGRGLRKSQGKHDCFVLEFSGNDPKMICWEDIDENCTFQSATLKEKQDIRTALNSYKSKFKGVNIQIMSVRVSPFKFYECKVRRMVRFMKDFRFVPMQDGFSVFEFVPVNSRKGVDDGGIGKVLNCWTCFWKEEYKSFYIWEGYGPLYDSLYGWTGLELERQIAFYSENQPGICKWYPSEEETITARQQSFLIKKEKMNARKAEMFIEDCCIKQAIKKYWIEKKMPMKEAQEAQGEGGHSLESVIKSCKESNEVYALIGKY